MKSLRHDLLGRGQIKCDWVFDCVVRIALVTGTNLLNIYS